jgi:hypothetical protein
MSNNKLDTLLSVVIIPRVVGKIHQKQQHNRSFTEALNDFYHSQTFNMIADYKTGTWHLSPETIAQIYMSELANDLSTPRSSHDQRRRVFSICS